MPQDEELNQAIALIQSGRKIEAVPILKNILKANRDNELAWLWLAYCVPEPNDKIFCFHEALRINPNNEQVKKALEQLAPKLNPQQPIVSRNPSSTASKPSINRSSSLLVLGLVVVGICMLITLAIIFRSNSSATFFSSSTPTVSNSYFQTEISKRIEAATLLAKIHPSSTPTPDLRSDFEKCEQSGYGIRYVISGQKYDEVSLTWENDTGGISQGDQMVPLCMTFYNFHSGDFVSISAQITFPTENAGSVECTIYDGNRVIAQATANGFPSIADCSGSAN